jgi:hypothetical protein
MLKKPDIQTVPKFSTNDESPRSIARYDAFANHFHKPKIGHIRIVGLQLSRNDSCSCMAGKDEIYWL